MANAAWNGAGSNKLAPAGPKWDVPGRNGTQPSCTTSPTAPTEKSTFVKIGEANIGPPTGYSDWHKLYLCPSELGQFCPTCILQFHF